MDCGPTLMDPVHMPEFKSFGVTLTLGGSEVILPAWVEEMLRVAAPPTASIKEYRYDI